MGTQNIHFHTGDAFLRRIGHSMDFPKCRRPGGRCSTLGILFSVASLAWTCQAGLQFTDAGANLMRVDQASVARGDYDDNCQLDQLITGSGTSNIANATNSTLPLGCLLVGQTGPYTANTETSTVAIPGVTNISPIHYVNVAGVNPVFPYSDWPTAATNIQDAIDASVNGDEVLVTNGLYQFGGGIVYGSISNRVMINKTVTVASVNGPAATFIQGFQLSNGLTGDGAVRCVYMTNGATLAGFTLTNGATRRSGDANREASGGGIWCESAGSFISNCVITANTAWYQGGGAYQGTLVNCVLSGNLVASNYNCYGGAAFQSALSQCIVIGNSNQAQVFAYGGALCNVNAADCVISSNYCIGNFAEGGGSYGGTIINSALVANACDRFSNVGEGYGGGAYNGNLVNCTVVNNYASFEGGGTYTANELNCINYFNVCPNPDGMFNATNASGGSANYCCSMPRLAGVGCITNDPLFSSIFHLSTNSPCRGAGTVFAYNGLQYAGTDIDGEPWAKPPSIGCDEIYPGSVFGEFSVSITADFTNLAPGFPGNFQANLAGPTSGSVWNFGDGMMVTNQAYISHAWATSGDYVVTLTGYNDADPAGRTATLTIHISVPGVYYVDLNCPYPVPPYSYWSTAANNIQDAVDVAAPGSLVLVTNGNTPDYGTVPPLATNRVAVYQFGGRSVYGISNRVAITKPLTLASVSGPLYTCIAGAGMNNSVRGVYLTNGAVLIGFTITNAAARSGDPVKGQSGGGIWCESPGVIITNCTIASCFASYYGSGVYSGTLFNCQFLGNGNPSGIWGQYGGGADASILYNCTLISNVGQSGGGAAYSILRDCTISNNSGSGTYSCGLSNCTLIGNSSTYGGGAQGGALTNCTLVGNLATAAGGGAYGNGTAAIVLNDCLITSNSAQINGGGVDGGSAYSGGYCLLNNCTLLANSATNFGGGAANATMNNCVVSKNLITGGRGGGVDGGMANGCTIIGNWAPSGAGVDGSVSQFAVVTNCILAGNVAFKGSGGGAYYATLYNCTLDNNVATNGGAGGANFCSLSNCTLSGNVAYSSSGGGAANSTLYGCLVVSNVALGPYHNPPRGGGGGTFGCSLMNCILAGNLAQTNGGGDAFSTLVNCTVVGNSASAGGGVFDSTVENSVVFDNSGGNYYFQFAPSAGIYYSCTSPSADGPGNITNDPAFVNLAGGDFHLQPASPCINSGDNQFVALAYDFDGNSRIIAGTVDIGAYEFQAPSSILSYAWAQQYGLPTDGSADYLDLDGTGRPNWQKSTAGLNPTNPASMLVMAPLTAADISANGVTVTWQSVNTRTYYLLRATNLSAPPAFLTIQGNLAGQSGTTSVTDTSATNGSSYFYQVGVQ